MGYRFPAVGKTAQNVVIGAGPVQVTAIVSPPIELSSDFQQVLILWHMAFGSGTTGPVMDYRLFRGASTAGVQITSDLGIHVTELGGSIGIQRSGCYVDTPGATGVVQYTLALNITNASSSGTITDCSIILISL